MTQNEYDKWYRELNEAQKEATDEFYAWKEKASKGKDCYADIGITRINGKAEVALREGEYISPFRGFQMSLKQNGRILSSCNWRCEDGVEKFPLLFSTKTFKSGKIAAGIFVRDGAMQSPIILGCPDDFEPDAFYEVFVHAWGAEMGYLWEGDGKIQGLTRIDYLLSGNLGETQNPIEKLVEQMYFQKTTSEETNHVLFNSHDGSSGVKVAMTPVRVVCQNTLNLALGTAKRIWTARHTENVLLRVQDARETLQLANSYMGELGKGIHELTTIKLSDRKVQEFINEFFPITEDLTDGIQGSCKKISPGLKSGTGRSNARENERSE